MFTRSFLIIFVAICLFTAPLCEAKGRGGGGGRGGISRGGSSRGGSSRGGSSRGGSSKSKHGGSKPIRGSRPRLPLTSTIVVAAVLYTSRPRYRTYRTSPAYESDYYYYDSTDLNTAFNVNGNQAYTAFFLPYSKETILDCLIVPKNHTRSDCPLAFKKYVTNTTRFYFPKEFNVSSGLAKIPTSQIALCCGAWSLLPSAATMLLLLAISFLGR